MNSEQYQHIVEMRSAYFKRLCVLELKEARLGVDTPAHILVDIEELRSKISEIDLQVQNHAAIHSIEDQRKGVYKETDAKKQVEIIIQGRLDKFTSEALQSAIRAFAAIMEIPPERVAIVSLSEGSIKLRLEVPAEAAEKLLALYQDNNAILNEMGVTTVSIITEEVKPPARVPVDMPWLQRFLQHFTARRAGGDVIAANVEWGAQGVAVGKNIIQIGTFQIPIWWLIALIIVVAIGLGYIALKLTPTAGPEKMDKPWNIAVAPFVKPKQPGLFGRTSIDNEYSLWVFNALEKQKTAFEQFDPKLPILIWNDSMPASVKGAPIGPIMGDTVEIRRKDALKVAERINAHVVIYGNIDSQGNFIPEFYVKPELEHDVDAITGGYQLGDTPIQLDPSNPTATADKLATRANALFWLVIGVDYIVRGDTTKAFEALDLAQNEFVQMRSHEGEELLYFFRGQSQLFQARDTIGNRCTLDKVKPYLDEAENNLRQALTLDPRFLRAQVALSGVSQLRAQCVPSATRLTSKEMAQAIAEAQQSLKLAPQSEDRVTAEGRAVYQMGVVYNLLGSTYLDLGRAALKEGKVDLAKQQFVEADRNFDAGIAQVQQSREAMSQADNPQRAQAQVYRALGNATAQKAILRQEQHQTNDLATLYTTANQYYQQCIDQGKANQHDKVLGRIIDEATVGCAPRATFVQNALMQLK